MIPAMKTPIIERVGKPRASGDDPYGRESLQEGVA